MSQQPYFTNDPNFTSYFNYKEFDPTNPNIGQQNYKIETNGTGKINGISNGFGDLCLWTCDWSSCAWRECAWGVCVCFPGWTNCGWSNCITDPGTIIPELNFQFTTNLSFTPILENNIVLTKTSNGIPVNFYGAPIFFRVDSAFINVNGDINNLVAEGLEQIAFAPQLDSSGNVIGNFYTTINIPTQFKNLGTEPNGYTYRTWTTLTFNQINNTGGSWLVFEYDFTIEASGWGSTYSRSTRVVSSIVDIIKLSLVDVPPITELGVSTQAIQQFSNFNINPFEEINGLQLQMTPQLFESTTLMVFPQITSLNQETNRFECIVSNKDGRNGQTGAAEGGPSNVDFVIVPNYIDSIYRLEGISVYDSGIATTNNVGEAGAFGEGGFSPNVNYLYFLTPLRGNIENICLNLVQPGNGTIQVKGTFKDARGGRSGGGYYANQQFYYFGIFLRIANDPTYAQVIQVGEGQTFISGASGFSQVIHTLNNNNYAILLNPIINDINSLEMISLTYDFKTTNSFNVYSMLKDGRNGQAGGGAVSCRFNWAVIRYNR